MGSKSVGISGIITNENENKEQLTADEEYAKQLQRMYDEEMNAINEGEDHKEEENEEGDDNNEHSGLGVFGSPAHKRFRPGPCGMYHSKKNIFFFF